MLRHNIKAKNDFLTQPETRDALARLIEDPVFERARAVILDASSARRVVGAGADTAVLAGAYQYAAGVVEAFEALERLAHSATVAVVPVAKPWGGDLEG